MLLCSCAHAVNQKYRKSEISLDSGTHGTRREAALLTHNKLKWRHATPAILRHSTFKTKNPGLTFSLVPHCMCWGVKNRELLLADHSFYEVRIDVKLRNVLLNLLMSLTGIVVNTIAQVFFKENVRYLVWTCKDLTSLILGIRFSLILGIRW